MKSYALVVRDPGDLIELKRQLVDFTYDEQNPDFVVSFGGDGTYLVSEHLYPGIPKLLIKKGSSACPKCSTGDIYHLVSKILKSEYAIKENIKLEASYNGKKLVGTNDIVIRNKYPTHALRFRVHINNRNSEEIIIGDGVVVSTPHGSTAYYQSITRKSFDKGIGVAFNNPVTPQKHLVLDENSPIIVEVVRGNAVLAADNNPEVIELLEGQVITIIKAEQKARIIRTTEKNQ